MWTNSLLKQNAWANLKGYYWTAFGVTILSAIMGADGYSSGGSSFGGRPSSSSGGSAGQSEPMEPEVMLVFLLVAMVMVIIIMAFSLALIAFVGNPTICGRAKFFCTARNGDARFSHLFDNFKGGNYMPTVKTMFLMSLYQALWSLLFIIPGIIKGYEYALIPYLVAENPHIDSKRAFQISKEAMDGEKFKLFVLQLSFIGWYLLGYLACCVGTLFVVPYQMATEAEFYMCMRAKILAYGIATEDELSGTGFNGFEGDMTYGNGGMSSYPNGGGYGSTSYTGNDPYRASNSTPYSSNPYDQPSSTSYQGNDPYHAPSNDPYGGNTPYNGSMPGVDTSYNPYDDPDQRS